MPAAPAGAFFSCFGHGKSRRRPFIFLKYKNYSLLQPLEPNREKVLSLFSNKESKNCRFNNGMACTFFPVDCPVFLWVNAQKPS
jgi:hypothetical protein